MRALWGYNYPRKSFRPQAMASEPEALGIRWARGLMIPWLGTDARRMCPVMKGCLSTILFIICLSLPMHKCMIISWWKSFFIFLPNQSGPSGAVRLGSDSRAQSPQQRGQTQRACNVPDLRFLSRSMAETLACS